MIKAEARLGADDEEIERVGYAGFKTYPPPRSKAGEHDFGATPAQDKSAGQQNQSERGRPGEKLAPFEKQPTQRDECGAAAGLAGNQSSEMAISFHPGREKAGQQPLLPGRADDAGCCDRSSEPLVPGRA